jgi:uncharacterized membrane-anchored protein
VYIGILTLVFILLVLLIVWLVRTVTERSGNATRNRSLRTRGKADQAKAKTTKATERVKDRLR